MYQPKHGKPAETKRKNMRKRRIITVLVGILVLLLVAFSIFAARFCSKRYETSNFIKVGIGWLQVRGNPDKTVKLVDKDDHLVVLCNRDQTESGLLEFLAKDAPFGIDSRLQEGNTMVVYQSKNVAKATYYFKRLFGIWDIRYISMEDYQKQQEQALQEMMETMNDQDLEAFTDNNGIGEPAEADS